PEADQRLERLDRPEGAVLAEAVDRLLHLERGRHEGGHHRAGAERRGGGIEKAPGLGQVDHQAIDLALLEAGEGVGGAEGPVGCGAVVAGDVVARQRREVLARLVGGELPGGADGALPHRRRLGRGAHAGTSATAGDLFACTSRTRRQKAQSEPYAGMPQPSHCFGSSRSTWAKAGCAARRNSFTKASLVPGLAASSRLSTSL